VTIRPREAYAERENSNAVVQQPLRTRFCHQMIWHEPTALPNNSNDATSNGFCYVASRLSLTWMAEYRGSEGVFVGCRKSE